MLRVTARCDCCRACVADRHDFAEEPTTAAENFSAGSARDEVAKHARALHRCIHDCVQQLNSLEHKTFEHAAHTGFAVSKAFVVRGHPRTAHHTAQHAANCIR